jgi:glycosyltransferase involved in cell wall biosynthesis
MRIAFDFNPVLVSSFSGFHTYGTGLLGGFASIGERPGFALFHSRRFATQARAATNTLGPWAQPVSTAIKPRYLEAMWRFSGRPALQYFTGEFDVYHCVHHLMPPTKARPRLMTVHDLRRHKLPELYARSKFKTLLERAIRSADHFIAVSESTKNDLCEIFDVPEVKVDVVYHAAALAFEPAPEAEKPVIKKVLSKSVGTALDRYLLAFSSPDRRKNIYRVIEAFNMASDRLPADMKLVLVGSPPRGDESLAGAGITDRVVAAGPMEDVSSLLRCADGLVFASCYEGFGIPVLEAFSCGVPVITSNVSSLPEVAGDAAVYVDPYSSRSIAEAMVALCGDAGLRERLVRSGLERNRLFTWKKTAEKTLEVYRKLA